MKVVSIVGARPQFVKEAVLQKALLAHKDVEEVLIHTGQHYDANMSDVIFSNLGINAPKYNLNVRGGTHGAMTGQMIIEIEKILLDETPDVLLVYGDTNSTLAGAIAATKLNIPIAHVEAGLRQEPKSMPEEKNRVLTDRISKHLYVPSQRGINNLKREGIEEGVVFSGDVMYDVFLEKRNHFTFELYDQLALQGKDYAVLTMHRDFNVDHKAVLECILHGLNRISKEIPIVFPIHPRTKARIQEFGLGQLLGDGIIQIEPSSYLDLMGLTQRCRFVISDSGGYQKEAYFSGKQGLILMPDTAWRELVDCGANYLVDGDNLFESYQKMSGILPEEGIYGNGRAGEIIAEDLCAIYAGG